jgi:hypothetical protein
VHCVLRHPSGNGRPHIEDSLVVPRQAESSRSFCLPFRLCSFPSPTLKMRTADIEGYRKLHEQQSLSSPPRCTDVERKVMHVPHLVVHPFSPQFVTVRTLLRQTRKKFIYAKYLYKKFLPASTWNEHWLVLSLDCLSNIFASYCCLCSEYLLKL